MKREIKFRQFIKGRMEQFGFIEKFGGIVFISPQNPNSDEYPVMQFTGLRDRYGVEIYEGDIVSDHVGTGAVEYSTKKAAFKVNYMDGFAKWFIDYTLYGERDSIRVIGNIHQNPELLGGAQ